MPTFQAWLLAIRLKTLPAAIVPVWAGCLMAWKLAGQFHLSLAVATLLGALFIQIATNFFNDVIDADKGTDTEKRLGPQRVTASGLLSRGSVLRGAFLMLALATLSGLYLFAHCGWEILVIGLPSLYLSYGYTGGMFPLAYRGMGEVFVILFFGLVAVGGTVFVQLDDVPKDAWLLGLQIGCLSAVLIAINNFRDLEEDRAAGKNTIVVRFGRVFAFWGIQLLSLVPLGLIFGMSHPAIDRVTWFKISLGPSLIFYSLITYGLWKALRTKRVGDSLLGVAALQLIVFVILQSFVMSR